MLCEIHVYRKMIQIYMCVCVYTFPEFFHYTLLQDIAYSSLCYTVGSILYMVVYTWCDHSPRARYPEFEVKWALGSTTMNKASGGDGIPVELFKILKDDAVTVLHSICQQIWKTQQWPQDWKSQFSFQSQKRQCQRMLKLLHNCTHLTG